ncbi:GNAT family N-acetyltransferase [Pedobacter chitinilyticus]|uniref:GNAT family N-acetyltransferase n=1 Tax=Pedobacter chitinilyticus TaxID=2233776 RepID=A0A3S3PDE9_9SPHI|nr:GNAT family N-acetyltransferase [Pedobacter chitinilyticus]RWU10344.1 GNAT family N-acetyltransferase [Pedobacter chitinilyticus]
MNIKLRRAIAEDCPRLLELIMELAIYEKAPQEVTVTLDEFVAAGFGENPVWKSFVAVDGENIVGLALFYVRYSTWKGCRLYLEDFLVTENYRGKGIGKLLFDRVVQEAKEGNFNGMNWQVLDWNTPAINFYDKYGAAYESEWLNASFSKEQLEALN